MRGTVGDSAGKKVHCTCWIDSKKNMCNGAHSIEDHKAAIAKYGNLANPLGSNGRPKGKGKKGKKGKENFSGIQESSNLWQLKNRS